MAIGQIDSGHVHFAQLDFSGRRRASAGSAREHRRAEIDAHDLGAGRVEWKTPPRAHAGVEYQSRKAGKELRPDLAIATIFERQVQDIVERRDALIAREIRGLRSPHVRVISAAPPSLTLASGEGKIRDHSLAR